jgi:hypothetical protein
VVSGLPPLPGNPAGVREVADRLEATAQRLAALARVLARLRDGATWDSPAGVAFGARLAEVPPVLDTVAHRVGGAVAPLRSLATALEEAQAVVASAVRDDAEAEHAYAVLEDRTYALLSAGSTEQGPEVLALRHLQREQVELRSGAGLQHRAAVERFGEADAHGARVLRALAVDDVADSLPYRLLAGISSAGHDLAAVGPLAAVAPELRPVAAASDAAGTAADGGLLLAYGEGDWRQLATGAAQLAAGGLAGALRRGAVEGAEHTASGVTVTRSLTVRQRLALGTVQEVRARRDALRAAHAVPPQRGTASALLGGPEPRMRRLPAPTGTPRPTVGSAVRAGAAQVRAMAVARADRMVLDDWRLATANGAAARRMYAGGASLEIGNAAAARLVAPGSAPDDGGGAR